MAHALSSHIFLSQVPARLSNATASRPVAPRPSSLHLARPLHPHRPFSLPSFTKLSTSRSLGSRACGRRAPLCVAAAGAPTNLNLHMGETTMSFSMKPEDVKELNSKILDLMNTFKEKEKAERPQRLANMEYVYKGDLEDGDVFVEVFCNPNAHVNAFQAKALVTVRAKGLKCTAEAMITAIKADVDQYMDQFC